MPATPTSPAPPATDGPLVVVASGSSAAIALPSYLSEIRALVPGDLTVVLTASALRFVSAEVVGWFADQVVVPDAPGVNPVELALRARALTVLPASGNTVATTALGLMPTTASTVIGVHDRPALVFPQMHEAVWRKPLMQRHLAALREAGHQLVDPDTTEVYRISAGAHVKAWTIPAPTEAARLVASWLQGVESCVA